MLPAVRRNGYLTSIHASQPGIPYIPTCRPEIITTQLIIIHTPRPSRFRMRIDLLRKTLIKQAGLTYRTTDMVGRIDTPQPVTTPECLIERNRSLEDQSPLSRIHILKRIKGINDRQLTIRIHLQVIRPGKLLIRPFYLYHHIISLSDSIYFLNFPIRA